MQPASDFEDMIVCGDYAVSRTGESLHIGEATGPQEWRDARVVRKPALRRANATRTLPFLVT